MERLKISIRSIFTPLIRTLPSGILKHLRPQQTPLAEVKSIHSWQILPVKSKIAFIEVQLILRARGHGTTKDLDKVGTPHFAQFVPLENNQIGFFTVYDGSFDKYIADFTKNIGPVFDLIFKFTRTRRPRPVENIFRNSLILRQAQTAHRSDFIKHIPGLSVQDIHALLGDRKSKRSLGLMTRMQGTVSQETEDATSKNSGKY